jgi:sodium-dependent dicarboxylate transporter 2/3/5
MAEASEKSGLNEWLGTLLANLQGIPPVALVFIVTIMTAMITEVASNTATATILMPVLNDLVSTTRV